MPDQDLLNTFQIGVHGARLKLITNRITVTGIPFEVLMLGSIPFIGLEGFTIEDSEANYEGTKISIHVSLNDIIAFYSLKPD